MTDQGTAQERVCIVAVRQPFRVRLMDPDDVSRDGLPAGPLSVQGHDL